MKMENAEAPTVLNSAALAPNLTCAPTMTEATKKATKTPKVKTRTERTV